MSRNQLFNRRYYMTIIWYGFNSVRKPVGISVRQKVIRWDIHSHERWDLNSVLECI